VQALALYWQVEPRLEGNTLVLGDRLRAPLDQFGDIYIDFPLIDAGTRYLSEGAVGFSALEILDLENATVTAEEAEKWRYVFGDKIVLVGDTWEVTHDKFNTPTGSVYGVEIIASAIGTMMNGAPLRPASTLVESLVTALLLVALLVTSAVRGLAGRVLAAIGVYLVYIVAAGALYVYLGLGLVVSMTYPMLAGLFTLVAMSMRLFMIAERASR